MTGTGPFDRLSDLAPHYDAILCDVWGVIRGSRSLYPKALDALARYRRAGGRVILLSNSPRRAESLIHYLYSMGATPDHFDGAVSSGEAIHAELVSRAPGPAFKLGPDWDDALYNGTQMTFAPLEQAEFISCTGLFDYESETPDDYEALLKRALDLGLEMVCANPDIVVHHNDRLLYCAGALAELYEALGGTVVMAGKPHRPVYAKAYDVLNTLNGTPIDKARILAIGDGPGTDIAGATQEGLDAFFITDGVVLDQFADGFDRQQAIAVLAEDDLSAKYLAPALVW